MQNPLCAEVEITVPFHDCDPAGVVWHGNYFRYFEVARCALLEKIDYTYRQMADSGYYWPIVDSRVRYMGALATDQRAIVSVVLKEWEFRLVMEYEVFDDKGQLVTRANTVQLPVTEPGREAVMGAPVELRERVVALLAQVDDA